MTTTLELTRPPAGDAPQPAPAKRRRGKQRRLHRLIPVISLLLGAIVLIYPVVGTYYNNYHQNKFAWEYDQRVGRASAATLEAGLEAAHAYNDRLSPALLRDPYTRNTSDPSPEYREYLAQLNQFNAMARLRLPTIGVDLPVYHGTTEESLSRGVGHFFGTALPVGGKSTHAVLTGHSALPESTLFDNLTSIRTGDVFYVDVYGQTLAYQVRKLDVVLPDDLDGIKPVTGKDYLTLVTCTPYAVNSHRLLVRAERIAYNPATDPERESGRGMDWTPQPWMWGRIIAAIALLVILLGMLTRWIITGRRRKQRRQAAAQAKPAESTTTTEGGDGNDTANL